ncbi:MAG: beta-ketoacyl-ACP synthase II [Bacteroidales bacterium]|jgi:3-oxoacyl-[acyl-carrier-protein] synthase II|nr:beta-ketoacyl-ACP synthase II [Bacteroidales bacterium]
MELKRVVVTGIGTINPLGNNISDFWENLSNGKSGIDWIKGFDASEFKTRFACEVKDFDAKEYLDRKEIRKMDRFSQYALVSVAEAIEASGLLSNDSVDKDEIGVIWASGIGGLDTLISEMKSYVEGGFKPRFSPFFIPKMISDIAAGHISMKYGFRGPNFATVSACASSSNALIDAFNYIRLGKANAFVAGGSEAAVNEAGLGGFSSMQAISRNNDEYKSASRPFCATRDGFVMGEGAGALILEEYEHAKKRGANIIAELIGGGMSADAHHVTAPDPNGGGARLVMERVLKDAGIDGHQVDYINVHGTATPIGDVAELIGIQRVFGEHAFELNISSTKSMTGHLLGAAGALESIAAILAIKHNLVPPTINHQEWDENIDKRFNLTLHKAQERKVNYAMSNTFGFGGHNTSVLFKAFEG